MKKKLYIIISLYELIPLRNRINKLIKSEKSIYLDKNNMSINGWLCVLQDRGLPVPEPAFDGPSAFVPVSEVSLLFFFNYF